MCLCVYVGIYMGVLNIRLFCTHTYIIVYVYIYAFLEERKNNIKAPISDFTSTEKKANTVRRLNFEESFREKKKRKI